MATTTATIGLSSDVTDSALSVSNQSTLWTAGTTTGMNTMTSVTKVLSSTDQVDLLLASSVSTTHNYVYINNPSTDHTEFFKVGIGNAGGGSPTDTEEFGRLYGGDWMFIPWAAGSNEDIIVTPSVATDMTVEYMVFS